MDMFYLKPKIFKFDSFAEFDREFKIGRGDLVFTHEFIYALFIRFLDLECDFMFLENYGEGEPTNAMADRVLEELEGRRFKRIIAVGGGSVIDVAKLLVLKNTKGTMEIFEKSIPLTKERELIVIPTTCGTGSEVTNISIIEIKEKSTKLGLCLEELYADKTVLIPELLKSLPYKFFIFSSVDALIHAAESYLSPKSNCYTELFSLNAIDKILNGFLKIIENGEEHRLDIAEEFLIASNYAGIAFGNTGVGAVHALSYPLGGSYHVPHGEANYRFFTEVLKTYGRLNPEGKIKLLNSAIGRILGAEGGSEVHEELEQVLGSLIPGKRLRDYGMKEKETQLFADSVISNQQRLLINNYVPLSRAEILGIYEKLF